MSFIVLDSRTYLYLKPATWDLILEPYLMGCHLCHKLAAL
jgi:hypothetical protein